VVPARLRQPGWQTTTRDLGRAPVQEDARAVSGGRWASESAGKPRGCLQAKAIEDKRLVARRNFSFRFRPTHRRRLLRVGPDDLPLNMFHAFGHDANPPTLRYDRRRATAWRERGEGTNW